MKICKCGICIDDCDYHKVEPEYWQQVGFTTRPNPIHYVTIWKYDNVTWTVPEGVKYVIIEGWGGGGGGK